MSPAPLPRSPGLLHGVAPTPQSMRDLRLVADYFLGQIDLKAFRARHPDNAVLSTNPLVIEPVRDAWVFLEKFGAVVFWNCSEEVIQSLHEELRALEGVGERLERARDDLMVHVGSPEDRVGFSEVWLRELTLDKLKIVSLALAQSVALDHFEMDVSRAMARFHPVVLAMREHGRLFLSHREALQLVGFALEIRAEVLNNLTLFDDPPETWESESLAHLDSQLYDQFDLEERLEAIQQKLAYLADTGARVMDVLTTRKNHRLEWIIIILIAIEIVFFLWEKMPTLLHP